MAVTDLPPPVSSSAPAPASEADARGATPRAQPRALSTEQGLLLILGLALTSLLLLAAAVLAAPPDRDARAPAAVGSTAAQPPGLDDGGLTDDTPDTERTASRRIPALYPAEPRPVPQEIITSIEAASGEPLPVELGRLLGGIQEGFGAESVQLAPELRAYVFRMASRFDWNPDTFRVAVTAPSAELAEARATTLRRLFESATGSERLQIRSGAGPHALTLVSDS